MTATELLRVERDKKTGQITGVHRPVTPGTEIKVELDVTALAKTISEARADSWTLGAHRGVEAGYKSGATAGANAGWKAGWDAGVKAGVEATLRQAVDPVVIQRVVAALEQAVPYYFAAGRQFEHEHPGEPSPAIHLNVNTAVETPKKPPTRQAATATGRSLRNSTRSTSSLDNDAQSSSFASGVRSGRASQPISE